MRTVRLRQRWNRRFTTLGLVLSMGLILGAGQVIESSSAEPAPSSADREELAEPADNQPVRESPGASRAVHQKGHRTDHRSFQL